VKISTSRVFSAAEEDILDGDANLHTINESNIKILKFTQPVYLITVCTLG
jgi:hypothetical protein